MRSSDSLRVYDEQNPVVVESGWPWLSRAGEAVRSVGIDGIIRAKALFGGENMPAATQSGAPLADGDTWLWNGTWTKLTPTGSPPARYGATLSYDGGHNTDVLFGGDEATSTCDASCLDLLNDTWTWNGAASTWTQACTSCTVTPPPALGAAIAYHRAGVEDLLFGGYSDAGSPAAPRTTWIWTTKWAAG